MAPVDKYITMGLPAESQPDLVIFGLVYCF